MNIGGLSAFLNFGSNVNSNSQSAKESGLVGLNKNLQSLNESDQKTATEIIEALTSSNPEEEGSSLSALSKMTSFVELKKLFADDSQDKFDAKVTHDGGSYRFQGYFNSEAIVSVEYGDLVDELSAVREQKLTNHSEFLPINIDAPPEEVFSAIEQVEIENNLWKNVSGGNEDRIGMSFLKSKFEEDNGKGSEVSLTRPEINKWITTQLQSFDYFGKINPNKNEVLMNELVDLAMTGNENNWLKTAFDSLTTIRVEAEKFIAQNSIVTLPLSAQRV